MWNDPSFEVIECGEVVCRNCGYNPGDETCLHDGCVVVSERKVFCTSCGLESSLDAVHWDANRVLHIDNAPVEVAIEDASRAKEGLLKLAALEGEFVERG